MIYYFYSRQICFYENNYGQYIFQTRYRFIEIIKEVTMSFVLIYLQLNQWFVPYQRHKEVYLHVKEVCTNMAHTCSLKVFFIMSWSFRTLPFLERNHTVQVFTMYDLYKKVVGVHYWRHWTMAMSIELQLLHLCTTVLGLREY